MRFFQRLRVFRKDNPSKINGDQEKNLRETTRPKADLDLPARMGIQDDSIHV
jgi:hypothetical protein